MAKVIAFEPKPLYFYVHRTDSITTKSFSMKALDDIEAAQKNYEIIREKYPQAMDAAEFRIDFSTLKVIDKMMLSDTVDEALLKNLVDKVRRNKTRILKSECFTKTRKFSMLILLTNISVYRWFVRKNARQSIAD